MGVFFRKYSICTPRDFCTWLLTFLATVHRQACCPRHQAGDAPLYMLGDPEMALSSAPALPATVRGQSSLTMVLVETLSSMPPESDLKTSILPVDCEHPCDLLPVPCRHGPGSFLPTQGLSQWPSSSPPKVLEGAAFICESGNKLTPKGPKSRSWNGLLSQTHPLCELKDKSFETYKLEEQKE